MPFRRVIRFRLRNHFADPTGQNLVPVRKHRHGDPVIHAGSRGYPDIHARRHGSPDIHAWSRGYPDVHAERRGYPRETWSLQMYALDVSKPGKSFADAELKTII